MAVTNDFDFTLDELKREFEHQTDHRVIITPGPSSRLYNDIIRGVPFDVFLSDDTRRPAVLEQEGRVVRNSRFTYALSKLVLWSVGNREVTPVALREKDFHLLAVTNPLLSEYGRAARETLEALSLWEEVQDKLVLGENIGQTYQFAISEDVDLAFITFSQIVYGKYMQAGNYWMVPEGYYAPIEQQGVQLTDNPAAREFLDFMQSFQGRQIILGNGFDVP